LPISATAHRPDLVVGVVLNPEWRDPDLIAELIFWDDDAIARIGRAEASGKKGQGLSCGYRYEVDLQPGRVDGQSYEGVMRRLSANHLALVDSPRVSSAVVGDSAALPPRPRVVRPRSDDRFRAQVLGRLHFLATEQKTPAMSTPNLDRHDEREMSRQITSFLQTEVSGLLYSESHSWHRAPELRPFFEWWSNLLENPDAPPPH
jgi:hypothetical protein